MASVGQLRVVEDWRSQRIPRRYSISMVLNPTTLTAGTNLVGLRKLAANAEIFVSRLRMHYDLVGASTDNPVVGWKRATTVAQGSSTAIAAADIPKMDTAAPNASLQVFTVSAANSPTVASKATQYIWTHAAATSTAVGMGGGVESDWTARDASERIRLTGDEGLILDLVTAADTDVDIHAHAVWEEAI